VDDAVAPEVDGVSPPEVTPPADVPPIVCLPTAPSNEVCAGIDNDCDGSTDQPSEGQAPLCNDGNACTVDLCSGKLGCKSIVGCFGPTDYQIKAFSLDKAEVGPDEVVKITLTVSNLGKPYAGHFQGARQNICLTKT